MLQRSFFSLDDFITRTEIRHDELLTLAEIGALNAFGYDRRTAMWKVEKAVKKDGLLFRETKEKEGFQFYESKIKTPDVSPLPKMTPLQKVVADYQGTGLTLGQHPMAFFRKELKKKGVQCATDLLRGQNGRYVRVAGAVIARQRPGTAKGFLFVTLEDETGMSNIIVRPSLFAKQKEVIIERPFLLVGGKLQSQDGVTSIKANFFQDLSMENLDIDSHDFC